MENPNTYKFWYEKAMKSIHPHSLSHLATKDLERALELNPYHINSWIWLAGIVSWSESNDYLIKLIEKLTKLEPATKSNNLFQYALEKVLIEDYSILNVKACGYNIDLHDRLERLGELLIAAVFYVKNDSLNKGLEYFEKALLKRSSEEEGAIWYIYSFLCSQIGKYDSAINHALRAIEKDNNFKSAKYQLGESYYLNGEYNKALNIINILLKQDSKFENAFRLKSKIEEKTQNIATERETLYQGQKVSKIELDFLTELEKIVGEAIPAVGTVLTKRYWGVFGFVAKSGHVVELGLSGHFRLALREIPESIGHLKHLEVLTIQQTYELMDLPESLIYLKNLKHLIYNHHPRPYSRLDPDQLPYYFCSLTSLEKLDLSDSLITTLPDCLAHFPDLNEINISYCNKLNKLSPLMEKCFYDQQYEHPGRRFLIRQHYPQRMPKQHSITESFSQYREKKTKEDQIIDSILSIIREGKNLEDRINAIMALKELIVKDEFLFKFLEDLLKNGKSRLVRRACADVILHKFPENALNAIKWILKEEVSVENINSIKIIIESSDSNSVRFIKDQLKDLLALNDIQYALGKKLQELNESEKIKNRCKQRAGYISKNNQILALTLNTRLEAFNKDLIELHKSVGELEHLEDLKLIDCRELTTIPESIGNLQKLNALDCTGCRSLEALPNKIGSLKNLERLDLTECFSLKQLPSTITDLKNLKSLTLSNCQSLTSLPQNLGDLTSLQVLDLENCRSLKTLPESIINLPNIKILRLKSCNSLECLPKNIGNLQSIKNIELVGCNRLSSIPESISKLKLLESLDLSYCYSLIELPSSIGTMRNLNSIILRGCRELESLPSNIGTLKKLRNFDLYACRRLKKFPESFKKLKNLIKLDLSFCDKLPEVPTGMNKLSNLTIIKSPINSKENSAIDNLYNIQPDPYFPGNELSPYRIKQYQEKIQSNYVFPWQTSDKFNHYTNQGIIPQEAKIMAQFSVLLERDLIPTKIYTNLDENQDDMHWMGHFKINNDGRVIELHIHQAESIYLTLFPKILCTLEQLEVIRFPNNCIETIPECITNLKLLKVLDVSNLYAPNPNIPETIKSFVESFEKFNEFYNY